MTVTPVGSVEGYMTGGNTPNGFSAGFTWDDPEHESVTSRSVDFTVFKRHLLVPIGNIEIHTNDRLIGLPREVRFLQLDHIHRFDATRLSSLLGHMSVWYMFQSYRSGKTLVNQPVAIGNEESRIMQAREYRAWQELLTQP